MTTILVVDDSPVEQRLAGRLLQSRTDAAGGVESTGYTVAYAAGGREALAAIARDAPAAVVTDLQMPDMNGLELVAAVRAEHPLVPVIVMTGHGSEELAVRALQAGAASYVPKRSLAHDLVPTVEAVVEAAQTRRDHDRLMRCLTRTEAHFVLGNDPSLIPPLVGYLRDNVFRMSGSDDTGLVRASLALREALLNAMEHGNLEKCSGRGLLLMRAFMSEVRHNDRGNEITLIRRPE